MCNNTIIAPFKRSIIRIIIAPFKVRGAREEETDKVPVLTFKKEVKIRNQRRIRTGVPFDWKTRMQSPGLFRRTRQLPVKTRTRQERETTARGLHLKFRTRRKRTANKRVLMAILVFFVSSLRSTEYS